MPSMAGWMESAVITPTCRAGRTVDGAWDEAVRRLREIYEAQVSYDPTVVISLAIFKTPAPSPDST